MRVDRYNPDLTEEQKQALIRKQDAYDIFKRAADESKDFPSFLVFIEQTLGLPDVWFSWAGVTLTTINRLEDRDQGAAESLDLAAKVPLLMAMARDGNWPLARLVIGYRAYRGLTADFGSKDAALTEAFSKKNNEHQAWARVMLEIAMGTFDQGIVVGTRASKIVELLPKHFTLRQNRLEAYSDALKEMFGITADQALNLARRLNGTLCLFEISQPKNASTVLKKYFGSKVFSNRDTLETMMNISPHLGQLLFTVVTCAACIEMIKGPVTDSDVAPTIVDNRANIDHLFRSWLPNIVHVLSGIYHNFDALKHCSDVNVAIGAADQKAKPYSAPSSGYDHVQAGETAVNFGDGSYEIWFRNSNWKKDLQKAHNLLLGIEVESAGRRSDRGKGEAGDTQTSGGTQNQQDDHNNNKGGNGKKNNNNNNQGAGFNNSRNPSTTPGSVGSSSGSSNGSQSQQRAGSQAKHGAACKNHSHRGPCIHLNPILQTPAQ